MPPSMETAVEEEKGRLTMRVKTAEGMVLVKTPGTYRQASNFVSSVHYLSKYADTILMQVTSTHPKGSHLQKALYSRS